MKAHTMALSDEGSGKAPKDASAAELSRLERFSKLVDIGSKGITAIVAVVVTLGLGVVQYQLNTQFQCSATLDRAFASVQDKKLSNDALIGKRENIPDQCIKDMDKLFKQLRDASGPVDDGGASKIVETKKSDAPAPETKKSDVPPAPRPNPPTLPPLPPVVSSRAGWMAVGVLGSPAYPDVYFDYADGTPINFATEPALKGKIIKARWGVYIRRKPADFTLPPLDSIDTGECFAVDDVTIKEGSSSRNRKLIWADGQVTNCQKSQ